MATFYFPSRRWAGLLASLLLSLSGLRPALAQTRPDSISTHYEEEVAPAPLPSQAPQEVQVQEQHLWKLGLNNLLFLPANWSRQFSAVPSGGRYGRYGLHLAYERKLASPAWSVLAEISPYLLDYVPAGEASAGLALCARAQVAGRYYYNLGRRLRLGKSTGTFAGNYFSLALGGGFGRQAHETAFLFYRASGPFARFDAALLYGLQRRLGRRGFADFNVGIPLAISSDASTSIYYPGALGPTLAVNLRLGLCLGQ
jgi:hypothetical protein